MKFELLGILIRWHVGEPGRAIGNPNAPEGIAFDRESNRYGGMGSK